MSSPPEYTKDQRVDDYIDALPDWQRDICQQLRGLIHAADPEVTETIKRSVRPYFALQGDICALLATNDHVNLFLYDGAIVADPEGIVTGGHDNKTARMISFYRDDPMNAPALTAMLKQIIANNRAGGWRKVKLERTARSAHDVDEYLRGVDEPGRSTLQTLRRTILEISPDAEEVISYRVPGFRLGGVTIAGFAAFKKHLSYLPFSGSVLPQLADELNGYTMTKSSLHFPLDRPLPKRLVKKLINARLAQAGQRPR